MSDKIPWTPRSYNEAFQMAWDEPVDRWDPCALACMNEISSLTNLCAEEETSILDLGCGCGRLTLPFARKSHKWKLYGIDSSSEMIHFAKEKLTLKDTNIEYKLNEGKTIPYPDKSFDVVYSMLVFQHLPKDVIFSYLHEVYWVLKDKGRWCFQFVQGNVHNNLDHRYLMHEIRDMLNRNELLIKEVKIGKDHPGLLNYPEWVWVAGSK